MPILKCIIKFGSNNGQGWTEVHYKSVSSLTPQLDVQMDNFMDGVVAARAVLLGADCYVVGARISYPIPNGIAAMGRRKRVNGTAGKKGSDSATSVAIEMRNATFDRKKIIHLRGWWDDIAYDETYHGELFNDWQMALEAYIAQLKTVYGWPSRDAGLSAKGNCTGYVLNPNGTVEVTLDVDTPMPLDSVGKLVVVRFSKFVKSSSILNRALEVKVDSQVKLTTVKIVGAVEPTTAGKFNYRAPSFLTYAGSNSISLGERRMGRPLDRRPGRSKAIPLG